jgi:hypothetical protein
MMKRDPAEIAKDATEVLGLLVEHKLRGKLAKEGGKPERKPSGMYGETPRVKIGKYTISRQDDRSVWIEVDEGTDEGEGGAFPDTLFEQCIEDFYNKHL